MLGGAQSGGLLDALALIGGVLVGWTLMGVVAAAIWSLVMWKFKSRPLVALDANGPEPSDFRLAGQPAGGHGHPATNGSDISIAAALGPLSSPNFVLRHDGKGPSAAPIASGSKRERA